MDYEEQVLRRDLDRTRDAIGTTKRGITELGQAEYRADSDEMKKQFGDVITTKKALLRRLVLKADEIKDKLIVAERGGNAQREQAQNPYSHLHRSTTPEAIKMEIIEKYGIDEWMSMKL